MQNSEKVAINAETEVNAVELAAVLGLSQQRIYQLADIGVLEKTGRARFPLAKSIQSFIEYKISDLSDTDMQELTRKKLAAETAWKQSKARLSKMEEDELNGKLHRAEDVEAVTSDLVLAVREALIALPGRLATDMAAASTAAQAADRIRRETFVLMKGLAAYQYDPAKYQERVRERRKWESMQQPEQED